MYRQHFAGTPDELRETVKSLRLPDELPGHEAIRAFVLLHLPTYEKTRWQLTIACESAVNQGGNRFAGFIAVSAMEVNT